MGTWGHGDMGTWGHGCPVHRARPHVDDTASGILSECARHFMLMCSHSDDITCTLALQDTTVDLTFGSRGVYNTFSAAVSKRAWRACNLLFEWGQLPADSLRMYRGSGDTSSLNNTSAELVSLSAAAHAEEVGCCYDLLLPPHTSRRASVHTRFRRGCYCCCFRHHRCGDMHPFFKILC